jgi:DNA invertase Pin-like site-specific DNA recombinase
VVVAVGELDRRPYLLPCRNGTLDLRYGVLLKAERWELMTKGVGINFDPQARSDLWDGFLTTTFGADRELIGYVQRILGYAITGLVADHIVPVFYGSGANGKSTLLGVVQYLLGGLAITAPEGLFAVRHHEPHPERIAVLRGERLVVSYEMVSTEDKGQDPEVQLVPMREFAAARGWISAEYVDFAPASDLRGRREWRRLLDDARLGRIELVMVWKLDRFARSALDALQWLQQLDGAGVGLKILTQEIDTTSAAGRLIFTILAAVAEMERELVRERVRAGMARARARGVRLGRPHRERPLSEHPLWPVVLDALEAGHLNRAEAARKLRVRRATLAAALLAVRNGGAPQLGGD